MATLIVYSDAEFARRVRAAVLSGVWKSPPDPDAEHSIALRKGRAVQVDCIKTSVESAFGFCD